MCVCYAIETLCKLWHFDQSARTYMHASVEKRYKPCWIPVLLSTLYMNSWCADISYINASIVYCRISFYSACYYWMCNAYAWNSV